MAIILTTVQLGVFVALFFGPGRRRLLALVPPLFLLTAWGSAGRSLVVTSALSHAALYGGLCVLFGASLRDADGDIVTRLADRLEGPLSPGTAAYTRGVAWAWTGFFAAQLLASMCLALMAPAVWSLFVNVLALPLVGAMFLAEYGIRHVRFPDRRHVSILAAARAFARGGSL